MTEIQEIFNVVYRGMKSQGFKQSTNGYACRYRNRKKLRCVIGWLIPDELYRPRKMEGYEVRQLAMFKDSEHLKFLEHLQEAHDDSPVDLDMKYRLECVAHRFKLEIPNDDTV